MLLMEILKPMHFKLLQVLWCTSYVAFNWIFRFQDVVTLQSQDQYAKHDNFRRPHSCSIRTCIRRLHIIKVSWVLLVSVTGQEIMLVNAARALKELLTLRVEWPSQGKPRRVSPNFSRKKPFFSVNKEHEWSWTALRPPRKKRKLKDAIMAVSSFKRLLSEKAFVVPMFLLVSLLLGTSTLLSTSTRTNMFWTL